MKACTPFLCLVCVVTLSGTHPVSAEPISSSDHWSLQPIQAVTPPDLQDPWIRNPVDAFILDALRGKQLSPSPDAEPRTLIRRVHLDMLGIPPTPAEIDAFVADAQRNDRVLNQAPKFKKLQRQDELDEIIKSTSAAFLGLTIECARCHDHKFDPFTQEDYYSMQAVFAGVRYRERRLRGSENDRWRKRLPKLRAKIKAVKAMLEKSRKLLGLRPPIDLEETEERFDGVETTSLRFVIESTTDAAVAHLDELEVWSATEPPQNVALAANGARVSSSGHSRGGGAKHPDYVIDGKRQVDNFWKAEKLGPVWLKIDFPHAVSIDRIVWATRQPKGIPADYRVEVLKEESWIRVAHSRDRVPHHFDQRKTDDLHLEGLTPDQTGHIATLLGQLGPLQKEYGRLEEGPQAFLGVFEEPEATYVLNRGDPTQPLKAVAPDAPTILGNLQLRELAKNGDVPEAKRRSGGHTIGLWYEGFSSHASGAARLAGARLHAQRMVAEARAP